MRVYVIDSGIFKNHAMFQGTPIVDFKGQTITPYCGNNEESVVSIRILTPINWYDQILIKS